MKDEYEYWDKRSWWEEELEDQLEADAIEDWEYGFSQGFYENLLN